MARHVLSVVALVSILAGCASKPPRVGLQVPRKGDEIMVAGQLFHTGAPVVLWTDPGGYDAYRTERRFAPYEKASFAATTQEIAQAKKAGKPLGIEIDSPNRYNHRYTPPATQRSRGGTQPAVTQPVARQQRRPR